MSKRMLTPVSTIQGSTKLPGSKSISNRALMMCSLAEVEPNTYLKGLSTAGDTAVMQRLLSNLHAGHFDAGDAGTAFRFMAARLAITAGTHILTGSARMQERPIRPLVDALQQLGIQVEYLSEDGFPPLRIIGKKPEDIDISSVSVPGDVSSQFISALLLIAPALKNGLSIRVPNPRVSWSYVRMTIGLMSQWGVEVQEEADTLIVPSAAWLPKSLVIEPDWSSASYWFSAAALSQSAELLLENLTLSHTVQGDAGIVGLFRKLGVLVGETEDGILLRKTEQPFKLPQVLSADFTLMPDTAQTLAVCCAALGVHGIFGGLGTLAVKETDRLKALKTELAKVGVSFVKLPAHMSKKGTQFMLEGKAEASEPLVIDTYQDHRMAMAFAPLAFLGQAVCIEEPSVVAKSYPTFWDDWDRLCS